MESISINQKINSFAIRHFRKTADRDYIHARMAYRGDLYPQFLWSSIHSLEKYLKCILILNRVYRPRRKIGHEVIRSIELLRSKASLDLLLTAQTKKFIERLEKYGAKYRYLDVSWFADQSELAKLDRSVWEIRKFCNSELYKYTENKKVSLISDEYNKIKDNTKPNKQNTLISGGWLESVLSDKKHPARSSLVWNNLYFTTSTRKIAENKLQLMFENSTIYLYPEIIDEVIKYVHIPSELLNLDNKNNELPPTS